MSTSTEVNGVIATGGVAQTAMQQMQGRSPFNLLLQNNSGGPLSFAFDEVASATTGVILAGGQILEMPAPPSGGSISVWGGTTGQAFYISRI